MNLMVSGTSQKWSPTVGVLLWLACFTPLLYTLLLPGILAFCVPPQWVVSWIDVLFLILWA